MYVLKKFKNIKIEEDTHKKLKQKAVAKNIPLHELATQIISDSISKGIDNENNEKTQR